MGKLVLHSIMVAVVIVLGRQFGWAWWMTTLALIGGFVAVHLVFEALFSGSRHLGAAAVSNDDPLMVAAMADAKRTWPQFIQLFAAHP
jgi:predicted ferric reductase